MTAFSSHTLYIYMQSPYLLSLNGTRPPFVSKELQALYVITQGSVLTLACYHHLPTLR